METEGIPGYILRFCEKLKFKVRIGEKQFGCRLFYVNMANLRLSLSTITPLVATPRVSPAQSVEDVFERIRQFVKRYGLQSRISFAVVEGRAERLSEMAKSFDLPMVVVDRAKMLKNLESNKTLEWFLEELRKNLSLSKLQPYEKYSPVVGSRFFGRDHEIRRVLSDLDTNYAIMGIRRIGKTSLLQEIRRRIEEEEKGKTVFLTCSDFTSCKNFIERVTNELRIQETRRINLDSFPFFLKRMSKMYKGRIIFFLDEFDYLLGIDEAIGWRLSHILKSSSEGGYCRFVVSGFRKVMQAAIDLDSPLFQLMEPIILRNFSKEDVTKLVTIPMKNLGIELHRPETIVDTIYSETAGHPNFIQYYCASLVDKIDRTRQRKVTVLDIPDLHADEMFPAFVFETFKHNTTNFEKKIVYVMFDREEFEIKDIDSELKRARVPCTFDDILTACRSLTTAGILGTHGRDYYFSIPVLKRFLKERHSVHHLYQRLLEDERSPKVT